MVNILLSLSLSIMTVLSASAMNVEKIQPKEKPSFLSHDDTENLRDIAAIIFKFYQANPLSHNKKEFEHLFNAGLHYAALANNNNDFMSKQLLSVMLFEQAQHLKETQKKFSETIKFQANNLQTSPATIFFVTWNINKHAIFQKTTFGEKCTQRLNPLDNPCIVKQQNILQKKYEEKLELAQEHYLYDLALQNNKPEKITINDIIKEENRREERQKEFLRKEQILYKKLQEEANKGVYEASYLIALFELCGYNKEKEEENSLIQKIKLCSKNPKSKTSKIFNFANILLNIPQPENKKESMIICELLLKYVENNPELKNKTIFYTKEFLEKYGNTGLLSSNFFAQCIPLAQNSWSLRTAIIRLIETSCTNNTHTLETLFGDNKQLLAEFLKHFYTGKNSLIKLLILFGDVYKAEKQEEFVHCIDSMVALFNTCPSQEKISFYNQTRRLIKLLKNKEANLSFLNDTSEHYKHYHFYILTDFKGVNEKNKIVRLQELCPKILKIEENFAKKNQVRLEEYLVLIKNNLQNPEILYCSALLYKHGIPGIINASEKEYMHLLQKAASLGNIQAQLELAQIEQEPTKALDLYLNILSRKKNISEEIKEAQTKAEKKINQYLRISFHEDSEYYLKIRTFLITYCIKNQKISVLLNACQELFETASLLENSEKILALKKFFYLHSADLFKLFKIITNFL